jgi:hypothetical protein
MENDILIGRCLCGDEEGFEMLAKKYQNHVINTVYSSTGGIVVTFPFSPSLSRNPTLRINQSP